MVSGANSSQKRNWYKISVDSVRAWTSLLLLLTIVVGGFVGYRLLSNHLLDREVSLALEEADALAKRLQRERGISGYREKFDMAEGELARARAHYQNEQLPEALSKAERSRSLLASIVDSLRNRSPSGDAQFIATRGGVEVRRGERGEWRPARGRMVVHGGDYIKTSGNGSAEVMMVDGTLFTVRPGTVVLVSRARTESGRAGRTIALESGWVNLSTAEKASRVTTPKAEAEVRQRSEAVVSYDEKKGEGKFTAFAGGVRVAAKDGGPVREIGELQQVVQGAGGLSRPRRVPDPPELIGPADNLELYLDSSRELALSWRPVRGADRYALQVSGNRLFVDNLIDTEDRRKTGATLGLRGEGAFVWRVAALDNEGEQGPWSPVYRFRVLASKQVSTPAPTGGSGETGQQGG
ncbi:MAG: FecR domain-containing protein [Thermoanaerobaculia bacterium]